MSAPLLARRGAALAAAFLACVLWGAAFPTVKAGLRYLTPTFFAGARFTLAGLGVLAAAGPRVWKPASLRGSWRSILAIGMLQTVVGYWLFFHGMARSSGVNGSIINSSGILMTAVLARFLLGEGDWSWTRILGVTAGFSGVVLAVVRPGWRPDFSLGGEGLILLSALSLSYSSILAKKAAGTIDAALLSGGSMAFGGLVLLCLAAVTEPLAGNSFTPAALLLLAWSAFISATAFTLWYALLGHNPVSTLSTVKFSIPLVGSLLSVVLLGEEMTPAKTVGGLLVGVGIYLIFSGRPREPEPGGSF